MAALEFESEMGQDFDRDGVEQPNSLVDENLPGFPPNKAVASWAKMSFHHIPGRPISSQSIVQVGWSCTRLGPAEFRGDEL